MLPPRKDLDWKDLEKAKVKLNEIKFFIKQTSVIPSGFKKNIDEANNLLIGVIGYIDKAYEQYLAAKKEYEDNSCKIMVSESKAILAILGDKMNGVLDKINSKKDERSLRFYKASLQQIHDTIDRWHKSEEVDSESVASESDDDDEGWHV